MDSIAAEEEPKAGTRGRPTVKEKQFELRENMILDVANELLLSKGATLITLEDVITRVGISKPTFYLHFRSKEDLFAALMIRTTREATEKIREFSETLPPGEALKRMIEWTVDQRFSLGGTCYYDMTGLVSLNCHESVLAAKEDLYSILRELIHRAQEEGTALQGIPSDLLTQILMSIIKDFTYDESIAAGVLTLEAMKAGICRLILASESR
jgi:AcrR family transcriptional regulator